MRMRKWIQIVRKKGPLYYTVKEDLKDQIRKGELKKGGRLFRLKKMLCEEYQASRVTIRRAIEELIEEGGIGAGIWQNRNREV